MIRKWPFYLATLAWLSLVSSQVLADARSVQISVVVDIPHSEAWTILRDFSVSHNYVPNITRTEIVSSKRAGLGAHRKVYDADGDFLEETVIDWREGEGFVIKLHNGDEPMAPFTRAEFHYALQTHAPGKTTIALTMLYQLPMGSLGDALGGWFIDPVVEDNLTQVAAGMKHYYETGTPATDSDRERLAGTVQVVTKAMP